MMISRTQLVVSTVVVVLAAIALAWMLKSRLEGSEPVMCTMEAKQCPDGSYVGRTGPKCEFTPCPGL